MTISSLPRFILAALAAAALSGCAGKPVPPPMMSLDGRDCQSRVDVGRAISLKFGDSDGVTLEIDGRAPCVLAEDVRTTYVIFALPEMADEYLISIYSAPVGDALLAPHISILDAEGSVRREIARDAFLFRGAGIGASLRSRPGERYLVVASDPTPVGQEVTRIVDSTQSTVIPVGTGAMILHTGTSGFRRVIYAYSGSVTVAAQKVPKGG